MHYGRIDFDGDAVYLDDATDNLTAVYLVAQQAAIILPLQFVSEAFKDMRLNVKKVEILTLLIITAIFQLI